MLWGLKKVHHIFPFEQLIIGGGLKELPLFYMPAFQEALSNELQTEIYICRSAYGEYAGAIGAALLGLI